VRWPSCTPQWSSDTLRSVRLGALKQSKQTTGGVMASEYTYDRWMEAQGIPIHRGYYVEDLRTVEVGPWAWSSRVCK
jgi:hypothetical protein